MNARARLAVFALVVLAGLGGGWAVGASVGPIDSVTTTTTTSMHPATTAHTPEHGS
ncbi:MAG: hypothetical protein ACYC2O_06720 [Microthrixaceae bacterium]